MKITNAEIVAVAERSADVLTERRVLAAALSDPALQRRLALLRAADEEETLPTASPARLARLQEGMQIAARRVGREYAERQTHVSESSADRWASLGKAVRRTLFAEKRTIRLSALAPALAASGDTFQVQRDRFEIEGIRIEIHQLPEASPRLRFFVDASQSEGFLSEAASAATLALQEAGVLELWLVTVPLNAQGRGVWEEPAPAVRGAVELLGVALVEA